MRKYVEDLDFHGEEYVNEWTPWSPQDIRRKKGVLEAARIMLNSALTAPCAGGVPQIEGHLVYGQEELEAVARKVEEIAHKNKAWKEPFLYEAVMVRDSDVIIFLGNTRCHETPLDAGCGMCGGGLDCSYFYDKKNHRYGLVDTTDRSSQRMIDGPLCTAAVDDLGYAVGSALWTAYLYGRRSPLCERGHGRSKDGLLPELGYGGRCSGSCQGQESVRRCERGLPSHQYGQSTRTALARYTRPRRIICGFDYRKWIPKPAKSEEEAE